mgnify:CR=1 FL=1
MDSEARDERGDTESDGLLSSATDSEASAEAAPAPAR